MKVSETRLTTPAVTVEWDAVDCFNSNHVENSLSPIDKFFEKHTQLNVLCIPDSLNTHPLLAGLGLLGSVSAVESYFREVIRRTIVIDGFSNDLCHKHSLTYGAASVHDAEMLPEALIEAYSFASPKRIKEALKDLLGIRGHVPNSVEKVLKDFSNVCHFRHCMVHRFGNLGTNNAIALGLSELRKCIEKPLQLDFVLLQKLFAVNYNVVKTLNGYIYEKVINRTAQETKLWTWDLRKDKTLFRGFFDLFVSTIEPAVPSTTLTQAYTALRNDFGTK